MNKLFTDFLDTVDHVYGIYLDSVLAYKLAKERFEKSQLEGLALLKKQDETLTIDLLDQRRMHFGKGNPNSSFDVIHVCTQAEYKARNASGGTNFKTIGNLCLILIYQYWEDHYRNQIAEQLGVAKNEITLDIMGDLRILRRSIIHHRAIAEPDIKKCQIINWFEIDDEIFITENQFDIVIREIQHGIEQFASAHLDQH